MAWTLRLPKDLDDRLQSLCQSQGASKQRVVEKAVEAYLEDENGRPKLRVSPVLAELLEAEGAVLGPDVTVAPENVTEALEKLAEEPFMPRTMGLLAQESPAVEPKTAAREKKCVHLIEAGDFCPYCDESVT